MQLSLFSVENQSKELYRKHLRQFELQRALHELMVWERTVDRPQNLPQKAQAIQFILDEVQKNGKGAVVFLAHLRQNLQSLPELEPLAEDFTFLAEGINKTLNARLTENDFDFILENLHPAEIFLMEQEFEKALNVSEQYLQTFGEHPFLRQLQGAAYWGLSQEKESRMAYTMALFNNPLECKVEFFWPRAFKNKMQYLLSKMADLERALLHLPLALWEEGRTLIDPQNLSFEQFIEQNLQKHGEKLQTVKEIFLDFLHLLYLAEVERLRNFGREKSERLKTLQQSMRQRQADLYQRYENALRRFHML